MREPPSDANDGRDPRGVAVVAGRIKDLEVHVAGLLGEQNTLARQRTETLSQLAASSSHTAEQADQQTGLAQERTALTREQTRLSTRSTELANIRTTLAQERVAFAEERTRLAVRRTEMAHRRTEYSGLRTRLAEQRNDLARRRTVAAVTRTRLSLERTELAKGRTYLAVIRTGLAFLTVGLTLFRYFGVSSWTVFDAALIAGSSLMIYFGLTGFRRTRLAETRLSRLVAADQMATEVLKPFNAFPKAPV